MRWSIAALLALCLLVAACARSDSGGASGESGDVDGSWRCEELDYPCTWDEVELSAFEEMVALYDEVQAAMDAFSDPREEVQAAREILEQRDDLAEWGVDDDGLSGAMFRLEGSRPAVLSTELAAGVPGERSAWTVEELTDWRPIGATAGAGDGATSFLPSSSSGRSGRLRTIAYRPAGGPLDDDRSALVLDAFPEEDCDITWAGGIGCRLTSDEMTEGKAVAAILGNHPEIDVNLLEGPDVDPASVLFAGEYDLVHLVSHAVRACGDNVTPLIPTVEAEGDECYSVINLGRQGGELGQVTVEILKQEGFDGMPRGVAYNGDRWGITADFFNQVPGLEDTIVYLSACTSADGQVDPTRMGGFVGWEDYARLDGALDAAVRFWLLMVAEGLEFDLAVEVLREEGLDETTSVGGIRWNEPLKSDPELLHASLAARSDDNLRARDVVHDSVHDGGTLSVRGQPDDGEPDAISGVFLLVEGVRRGSEDDVELEILIDDQEIDHDLSLERDGSIFHEGDAWDHWRIDAGDLPLPFDLTDRDVDPTDPRPHVWEVRAYEDEDLYSAERAEPVFLSAQVRAEGEPASTTFGEYLGGPEATVDLSDLYLVLPLAGGAVEGEFEVVYDLEDGPGPVRSTVEFQGTFDPDTSTIDGAFESVETADDLYPLPPLGGLLEASVDLDAGTIEGHVGGTGSWWPDPIPFTASLPWGPDLDPEPDSSTDPQV